MPHLGPHISVPDDRLISRALGLSNQIQDWPEAVRQLAASLAAELFLVRSNPFVKPAQVRTSVERRLHMARPILNDEHAATLRDAVSAFWARFEADRKFRDELLSRLQKILPPDGVSIQPNTLMECATDATDLRFELPLFVLFPETEKQIQAVVKLANETGLGLIPRGGGTGLTGGAIPLMGRIAILSLSRFKAIHLVDREQKSFCAQAGVITIDAIKACEAQGLLFTVDPASKTASSLGGNVSENSGGPFAFEYGTTIDNILSYRMVTPTGEVIIVTRKDHPRHKIFEGETATFEIHNENAELIDTITLSGADIRKPGLGKDVSNKFLGGLPGVQKEGVDGIITECCFVLHDIPAHSRTLCLEFYGRSMQGAMLVIKDVVGLRDTIREQGDLVKISALEEFGPKYVRAIEYRAKSEQYEGDPISVLLLQLDSDDPNALNEAVDTIVALAQPYEGVDIFAARDEHEAELFWEDRHKLSAIAKRTSGFKINEDVVIPLSVVPEFSHFLQNLNLVYLAKAYRRTLSDVTRLEGVDYEHAKIREGKKRIDDILSGRITSDDLSDDEQEGQVRYLFQELRDAYPKLDKEIGALFEKLLDTRVVIANHMHAGDGNCHVNLPVNSGDPAMLAEAHAAAEEVFAEVLKLGGEVSGEHGIGVTKINFLHGSRIEALKTFKEKIDPKNVLNPGKLTSRDLPAEPYTFSFNRLIEDLNQTALKDKEELTGLLKNVQTCTRCGKCKQVCPMYHPERGLMYHPRNKNLSLGALIEAVYYTQLQLGEPDPELLAELRRLVAHCTACGKCTAVCPVKIDSAGAALRMRAFLDYKGQAGHPVKERVLMHLAKDPSKRLPRAAKVMSLGQSLTNAAVGLIPGFWRRRMESPVLQSQGPGLDFANLAGELKLDKRNVFKAEGSDPADTVLYFPGCGASLFSRSIGMATLYLLLKSRMNVVLPPKHLCCGYPLLSSGCVEAYKTNRHRVHQDILDMLITCGKSGLKGTTLVTACGTCRESLASFDFSADLVEPLARRDAVQLLFERGGLDIAPQERAVYHAACHTEWVDAPKNKAPELYRAALAGAVGGEVALSPGCCAESGTGAVTDPAIYNKLRERKKAQLALDLKGEKDTPLVVGCPSCKSGISRSLHQMGRSNPVLHTVEFLARAVGGPKWRKDLKRMLETGRTKGKTLTVDAQEK